MSRIIFYTVIDNTRLNVYNNSSKINNKLTMRFFFFTGHVRRLDGSDGGRRRRSRSRLATRIRGQPIRLYIFRDIHCVRCVFHIELIHRRYNR